VFHVSGNEKHICKGCSLNIPATMRNSKLESSLLESTDYFDQVVARREKLIKESRDIISLSSKSIVSLHALDFKTARSLHKQAGKRLEELREVAGQDLIRYLYTPEQEFVESAVLYALLAKQSIPSFRELGVLPSSYILGLLDAIGELKRSVYDSIRKGDLRSAESSFSTMESLFASISPFAVYDNIVQGVRRKLDVARILIEDTRATVTEEVRRQEFMQTVEEFSEKIGAARGSGATNLPSTIRRRRSSSLKTHRAEAEEETIDANESSRAHGSDNE